MCDEIAGLLLSYDNRFIDEQYYNALNVILMRHNNISDKEFDGIEFLSKDDTIKKFNFDELKSEFTRAFYYLPNKKIYLILENYDIDTRKWKRFSLNEDEHMIFSNLLRTVIYLHEFEHVKQFIGKPGLEGEIFKNCPTKIVSNSYALSPCEKFANLYSYMQATEIANIIELSDAAIHYLTKMMYSSLFTPYLYNDADKETGINDPTSNFFKLNGLNNPIDDNYANSFSLEERFIFGFAVTSDEYKFLSNSYEIDYQQIEKILEEASLQTSIQHSK